MDVVEIKKGFEIIDLGLLIDDTLVFSDFHFGYEEALNARGYLIPRFQFEDTMKRLNKIFGHLEKKLKVKLENKEKSKKNKITKESNEIKTENRTVNKMESKIVETIVVNGDLKHEFGKISETEWSNILKLIDYLRSKCEELVIIKGNHDVLLQPILAKRKILLADYYFIDKHKTIVLHGDKIPSNPEYHRAETVVIGNEHSAVGLKESVGGIKMEKCKCFLYGKFDSKDLIVLPSFNLVTIGTDVLKEKILSPFLKKDLKNFECFVVEDKVYRFGKLKDL